MLFLAVQNVNDVLTVFYYRNRQHISLWQGRDTDHRGKRTLLIIVEKARFRCEAWAKTIA